MEMQENHERKLLIKALLSLENEQECEAFLEDLMTKKEIADMLNISRSYVSRIETKAIGKLAKEIRE